MTQPFLDEQFRSTALNERLQWTNKPTHWAVDPTAGVLRVEPAAATDFWRRTHYGFEVDNGHLLACEPPAGSNWTLTTHVRFAPVHQYDQAGLMVWLSRDCWLKTSVEYEPEEMPRLGAVVTNAGWSDWSTQEFPRDQRDVWLRVRRASGDYTVEQSPDGRRWIQLRLAHLAEDGPGVTVRCGLYACSPKGAGFVAEFDRLILELVD